MPWDVKKRGARWCVVKQGESAPVPGGCHPTKAKAQAHQRALYASESADADSLGGYALAVSEGSDMSDSSNFTVNFDNTSGVNLGEFSVSTIMDLGKLGYEPIISGSNQIVGFAPATVHDGAETAAPTEKPWSGVLATVGSPTGDKRYLIPGEISHRDLPIPLQVQIVSDEGHGGAHTAGRIDQIDFIPLSEFEQADEYSLDDVAEDAIIVFATGMLDGSPAAVEAERLIANGAGISIDLPADREAIIDADTFEEVALEDADPLAAAKGKYLHGVAGKIAAATIVNIPAFEEAEIGLEEDSVLVASAHGMAVGSFESDGNRMVPDVWIDTLVAMAAPLKPDPSWFADPKLKKLTPLTITPEGRVYGHLADWDGCHTGFSNVCVPPFRSETAYAYFNTGEIECEDGSLVAVGKLMFSMEGGKHADTWLNAQEASQHYDDSTKVGAFVRAGTDRYGTWLAGALRPGLTDEEVQHLRSHPPSGDWRPIPGKGTELVAAFCVAVGGFPIPRAMVASGAQGELTIISAPLDLELGPHAVRRRFEVLKRKRKSMRPYTVMAVEYRDPLWAAVGPDSHELRDVSSAERKRLAKTGAAMEDGSFPIANCQDAKNARQAIGRAPEGKRAAVRAHIAKRERALGCSND